MESIVKKKVKKAKKIKKTKKTKKTEKKIMEGSDKEPVKELAHDGFMEIPRSLIFALRTHLAVISSFKEWADKGDPVGRCVKAGSKKALRSLAEAIADCNGQEKGELIRITRCICYSPFHEALYGYANRPILRIGKESKPESLQWRCAVCERITDYKTGKVISKGISYYEEYNEATEHE